MDWAFFLLLTVLSAGLMVHGLLGQGRFYQYPFLAAVIFFSFILPQIPGLANSRFVSDSALSKTLFLSCLCLVMCGFGWSVGARWKGPPDIRFSEVRLIRAAAALSIAGAYFFYKFGQLPDEERLRSMLTGTAVAYLFFAKLLTYGLAIALLCYAWRPSRLVLGVIVFDLLFYAQRIFIAGRRGEAAELGLMIALAFWFQRRTAVPRFFVMAGILMVLVGLLGAKDYRQATFYGGKADWSAVLDIDLAENWNHLLKEGGEEMRNAVNAIERIDEAQAFNYGVSHWNSTVFTYVPAQIVGHAFKDALLIEVPNIFARGYEQSIGSTPTGMTDSFASFWYFGAAKFFLIAAAMGMAYSSACRGNTVMQMTYMLSAVPSMLAITHFTNEIVIAWIHMFIFLFPAFYYARSESSGLPLERTGSNREWLSQHRYREQTRPR